MGMKADVYIKWFATITLIIGSGINSVGIYPMGVIIMLVGGIAWLIVSIIWKDPALIITNAVMGIVTLAGLAANYLGYV